MKIILAIILIFVVYLWFWSLLVAAKEGDRMTEEDNGKTERI